MKKIKKSNSFVTDDGSIFIDKLRWIRLGDILKCYSKQEREEIVNLFVKKEELHNYE